MKNEQYERILAELQEELVKMQAWVRAKGLKVAIIFEGRDAAGKGGVIKRITEHLNPRVARVVALPAPTDREKKSWYFQRYIAHLPCKVFSSLSRVVCAHIFPSQPPAKLPFSTARGTIAAAWKK